MTMRAASFAALSAILICMISGCGRGTEFPVITSGKEYEDILAEVERLSKPVFQKSDRGEDLEDGDRANLRESMRMIRGLLAYRPDAYSLQFAMGKAHQILGEDEEAIQRFEEAMAFLQSLEDPELRALRAETQYLASISLERLKQFESARVAAGQAVEFAPDNPNYLAALASAEIQDRNIERARALLTRALAADPNHRRALQLLRLITAETTPGL